MLKPRESLHRSRCDLEARGGVLIANILEEGAKVINLGIKEFARALDEQKSLVVHVDWRPPAEEDEEIEEILDAIL